MYSYIHVMRNHNILRLFCSRCCCNVFATAIRFAAVESSGHHKEVEEFNMTKVYVNRLCKNRCEKCIVASGRLIAKWFSVYNLCKELIHFN